MRKRLFRFIAPLAIALTAALVTACGGGGGGGASPPTSGGPPPGQTPIPGHTGTPAPSGHPSSTPQPTPTPTPAPTATPPSGGGSTIIADTTGRFGLIQILDNYGGATPLTTSQIDSEAPHYDSIWGSFSASTWDSAHPGMIVSRYFLPFEDENLISGHDLAYWKANHPDWILYACDQNGNPTQDLAWSGTGFADVPLDIHNPDVVSYEAHLVGDYMIANGYNTLAADNITFLNYLEGPNPELGEGSAQRGWYGCGVYQNGTFVRRYGSAGSSDLDQADPAFASDLVNWLAQVQNIFATDSMLAPHHLHIIVNHPVGDSSPNSEEQTMLSHVDGMVTENGYTHYGTPFTGSNFSNVLNWVEYLQANHKAAFVTDYFCAGSSCSNDISSLTPQQVDFALSSYALGNEGGEDLYTSPHGGSVYSYRPEYGTSYGAACGSYTQVSSSVYERKFQGALVVVNASGGPYSLTLSSNHTYRDIEGQAVGNPLNVSSGNGYVLLTSNGCS